MRRISTAEVRARLAEPGSDLLLICAYAHDRAFEKYGIVGSISGREFEARAPGLERDRPLVFYCACPADKTAVAYAADAAADGFTNAMVLDGGYGAWHGRA
ncbi:MAG: hypothetical protein HYZ53_26865 [Planctomycetes bacterium]|nr:hypothetical protein [Planctomycetota bacterium]